MKLLPQAHAELVIQAIQSAQSAGDLPEFDIPTIPIQPPKNPDHGDYASPVSLALAKVAKRKPLDIANAIAQHMPSVDFLQSVDVAPPGFLNFRLSNNWLKTQVQQIIDEGDKLFQLEIGDDKKAQVEFVSANPTGPITIGRSRGGIIGDTMARLLEVAGYTVQREYYFNNAGNQMIQLGKSLKVRYLQALGQAVELDDTHYQGEYLIDFAKELVNEHGDSWVDKDWEPFKEYAEKQMFGWIKKTLARVNISHDAFFNEHSLYENGHVWDVLEELAENGHIYESKHRENADEEEIAKSANQDPAQWFRSTTFCDREDRVVVKSDGSPTYTLPDIAYHRNKIERGFDLMVNVLGVDHQTEAKVVQYGLQALGLDPSGIHVIFNQMVRAVRTDKESGKKEEIKMSTRRGIYDALDDLIDMTSADAIRYHMLARSPNSHLDFDVDEVVKQSNDNPVYYIQNAYVRCRGIFRETEARNFNDEGADLSLLGQDELRFVRKVMEMGDVIEQCVTVFEPHKIAFYAHELAGVFHPIYDKVRVLHGDVPEDVAKARLRFYRMAQTVFKRLLNLMGMTAPERM